MEKPVLSRELAELPGMDGVYVSELVAGDAMDVIMEENATHPIGFRLLAKAIVREDGSPVFPDPEAVRASLPFRAYLRLNKLAKQLNGLDEDEAKKD